MDQSAGRGSATRGGPAQASDGQFRELHGRRLHGFALLVTLGDRRLAARASGGAIAAARDHADGLRHPERAAAWLRSRVVTSLPRRMREPSPAEERAALEPIGATRPAIDGLASLSVHERAALVAADIEGLDLRDVETVVGKGARDLERILRRARRRYMRAHAASPVADPPARGPLGTRIHDVAERALA